MVSCLVTIAVTGKPANAAMLPIAQVTKYKLRNQDRGAVGDIKNSQKFSSAAPPHNRDMFHVRRLQYYSRDRRGAWAVKPVPPHITCGVNVRLRRMSGIVESPSSSQGIMRQARRG